MTSQFVIRALTVIALSSSACNLIGCNSGGGVEVTPESVSFDSGEMKAFKDEFVAVLGELNDTVSSGGLKALQKQSTDLLQRLYKVYPKNAGAAENAITTLMDELDVVLEEAGDNTKEEVERQLGALLERAKGL